MKKFSILTILLLCTYLLNIHAEEGDGSYTYKSIGNGKYVVSVLNHQEIVKALTAFVKDKKIESGSISGIGAINQVTLRFFNPETKKYVDKTFHEQMEISNLTGNISYVNANLYLHIHITVGKADYSALAGHLLSAVLSGAGEFVVEDYGMKIEKTFDPSFGLNFYDLNK